MEVRLDDGKEFKKYCPNINPGGTTKSEMHFEITRFRNNNFSYESVHKIYESYYWGKWEGGEWHFIRRAS